MPDEAALDSAHLSRYDALLRTSKTLATHRTIGELVRVLGEELHPIIPFDYRTRAALRSAPRSSPLRTAPTCGATGYE
jgi:hypothetical protein